MRIVSFKANEYDENAYLIKDRDNVYLIDPGFNFDDIKNFLIENELTLSTIFLTHAHIDHTGDLYKYLSLKTCIFPKRSVSSASARMGYVPSSVIFVMISLASAILYPHIIYFPADPPSA